MQFLTLQAAPAIEVVRASLTPLRIGCMLAGPLIYGLIERESTYEDGGAVPWHDTAARALNHMQDNGP